MRAEVDPITGGSAADTTDDPRDPIGPANRALRTSTLRLERYIRLSMYVLLAAWPLLLVTAAADQEYRGLLAVGLLPALSHIAVCRWSLGAMRRYPLLPSRRFLPWLALWALVAAGYIGYVVASTDHFTAFSLVMLALGAPLAAVAPVFRPRTLLLVAPASFAVMALWGHYRADLDLPTALGLATSSALAVTGSVYSFWLSGWMLRVVWELDEARHRAADLAIAEERLRIARDLHDLFGRTLATVAVKSELAAELLRRGQAERAADEIASVRAIADQSGREVRQVVHGYRESRLDVELEGARSLLDSAGIRCMTRGTALPGLPTAVTSALAWSLREAVTNVIRHSEATECFISIETLTVGQAPDSSTRLLLSVTNNGAGRGPAGGSGNGLLGMAERLHTVGGDVKHQSSAGRFTVTASVPVAGSAAPPHHGVVPAEPAPADTGAAAAAREQT